jgi:shikimate kinase
MQIKLGALSLILLIALAGCGNATVNPQVSKDIDNEIKTMDTQIDTVNADAYSESQMADL